MDLPCLCIVTTHKILGLNICNLRKVLHAEYGTVLPFAPFDFSLQIPQYKEPLCHDSADRMMGPFVLDSKIYVAGGSPELDTSPSNEECHKIYEFNIKDKAITVAESIPDQPTNMAESFTANIAGDAYFLLCSREHTFGKEGFWVLRGGSSPKHWEVLGLPFEVEDIIWKTGPGPHLAWNRPTPSLVLGGEIFVQASIDRKNRLFSFNPQSQNWRDESVAKMKSFHLKFGDEEYGYEYGYCFPTVSASVEGLSNHNTTVMLSCMSLEWESSLPSHPGDRVKMGIYALLVNSRGVVLYQPLEHCFGVDTTFRHDCHWRSTLVDLGKGMVCALLYGHAFDHDEDPVLCVSVFNLSKRDNFVDIDADAAPPPKKKQFLSASVLRNGLFNMKECVQGNETLLNAFICPQDPDAILEGMFVSSLRLDVHKVPQEWFRRPEEAASTSGVE